MKVLITLGPTQEPIDSVRYITNASSGKMGSALAKESIVRGYETTIVSGPITLKLPDGARILPVRTAGEMIETGLDELRKGYDIFISTAAIADYSPELNDGKIRSGIDNLEIRLVPNPKLTMLARKNFPGLFIVAFKAEYGVSENELRSAARLKLENEGLDMVIANDIMERVFGSDTSDVHVAIRGGKITHLPLNSKETIARGIWGIIDAEFHQGGDPIED
jgi:phosphopantothenoylcysteine decarboxylase/phosphopantothenate--cysteine ligase